MKKDVVGIPLNIGDYVFDYAFNHKGTIQGFENEYVLVRFNGFKNIYTPKLGRNLISLEPHKITHPEVFI
jgi:hypothetical protein